MIRSNVEEAKLREYLDRLRNDPSSASFSDMRLLVRQFLEPFKKSAPLSSLGFLALMVNLTEHCYKDSFPLDLEKYRTPRGDQIKSQETQPKRVLSGVGAKIKFGSMAGRTNKTNIYFATGYIDALNKYYEDSGQLPRFDLLFLIWLYYVISLLSRKPIELTFDPKTSVRTFIRSLMINVSKRDRDLGSGKRLAGLILQHLVGARLETLTEDLPTRIEHHPAYQSDALYGRNGDFEIREFVIHVTTAPTEKLIAKCLENIELDLRPIIITTYAKAAAASGLAENAEAQDKIEVIDVESFFVNNIIGEAIGGAAGRKITTENLIAKYNELIRVHDLASGIQIAIK